MAPAPAIDSTPVDEVNAPTRASVGETVTLEVIFTVSNGCGRFESFSETVTGNTYTVAVNTEYVGEVCTQALVTLKANYSFTPTRTGAYTFRFWKGGDEFIVKTVVVE